MANWCFNYSIITHDDKVKVSDLYRISAGDFFNFILPQPIELEPCNKKLIYDKEFFFEVLESWRIENWGNPSPNINGWCERTISENGDYVTLTFDTKWLPATGIYEELESQGYRVKAYYWEPYRCICGSYIYGVLEHIGYLDDDQDIPLDVDVIMGIRQNKYWCGYGDEDDLNDTNKTSPIPMKESDMLSFFQGVPLSEA